MFIASFRRDSVHIKFSDRQVWAISADPDQTASQTVPRRAVCLLLEEQSDNGLF